MVIDTSALIAILLNEPEREQLLPAGLNFGDCFTYALAAVSGEPVLAKGNEFRRANLQMCESD